MKYFTFGEFERSDTATRYAIDNTIPEGAKRNIAALVDKVLDPLREAFGKPIYVNSGYRNPRLNKAVGGVATSQHLTGEAADITAGSREENKVLFDLVQELRLPFDQLIFERGSLSKGPDWVHVSYNPARHRRQIIYKVR